ncbi:MAG: HAMP domain-containing histidine kinase [Campylobacterales bacterium]|nr:HAMP domain-containing histidine kinase [Campylobacterales bacterium]
MKIKNKATSSLLKSESKSLIRFLTLYILLSSVVIVLLSIFYYESQNRLVLAQQRTQLSTYAHEMIRKLKRTHHFFEESQSYPRDERFKSAIYDMEYHKIFSLLDVTKVSFNEEIYRTNAKLHYVTILDNYYLGAKYLIIEVDDDNEWIKATLKDIVIFGLIALIVLTLFGLYLSRLFLTPMRNSILLLDRFIKDTTHELNTPLSTILANIELMDTNIMAEKNKKKLHRINIAAKTVSTIYKDLTYLTLEKDRVSNEDIDIDVRRLINDRVEYFDILAQSKNITFELQLAPIIFRMDKKKATRVMDNLISNAIKYNRRNGVIKITLEPNRLVVEDNGIGIEESKLPYIFDRYMRFNQSEGGFGIGLSIVKTILDEYNITIHVESKLDKGTKVLLQW